MAADPLLLKAGAWIGIAALLIGVVTAVAFWRGWATRFRLVGVTSFTFLLAAGCAAFAISYSPRLQVEGALYVPVVYDNGGDLVVAAAGKNFPTSAIQPTLEQLAVNLRGSGRSSIDGLVHVKLRQLVDQADGSSKPLFLGEAILDLNSGSVTQTGN
jgi:hypothetical protein